MCTTAHNSDERSSWLRGNTSLGTGFDSATFQISDNGNLIVSDVFASLASAQAFFSNNNLLAIQLAAGPNNVQLAFSEMMSGGEGFSFNYGTASVSATPLPSTWGMMPIGLIGFGFAAYHRKSKPAPPAVQDFNVQFKTARIEGGFRHSLCKKRRFHRPFYSS
jgi:hypothetical protein